MARGLRNHPDFDRLLRNIATIKTLAVEMRLTVFRSCEPIFATKGDLLTGEGSREKGGRWNPPDSFATVYTSMSDATALEEAKANYRYYGLDPADALPRVLIAVDVKLLKVLDLTEDVVRKAIGVSATKMRRDDWRAYNRRGQESLTQALGRAAYEYGLEGLVVPACDGGRNLAWFPGNFAASSKARIRNAGKLRRA
jgi:RES domain-containing protein